MMRNRHVYLAVILFGALALNGWLLKSSDSSGVLAGISFAVACFSLSFFRPFGNERWPGLSVSTPPRRPVQSASLTEANPASAAQIVNAFTIDLEDYFHTEVSSRDVDFEQWNKMPSRIESSVHRLLDLLDEHNTQATVFVLGWVAQRYPQLIHEVARRGHEIGCHSFRHRRVNRLTPEIFAEDTRMAKEAIEDAIGAAVEGYRAPSFSITPGTEWAFTILEQLGFTYDSSVHPVWHATYANMHAPRFPYHVTKNGFLEIPISTWRVGSLNLPVGGGAYLRLLPYSYIHRGLSAVNQHEWQPLNLYIHPWEIDYLQPAIHSDWMSHVRQVWGTRTMEAKLRRLLTSMRFAPIASVYARTLTSANAMVSTSAERAPFFAQVS